MHENPRQVAQDIIDIAFAVAHAFRINPDHFQRLSREEVNQFVAEQLAKAGYHVEITPTGVNGLLELNSPKP